MSRPTLRRRLTVLTTAAAAIAVVGLSSVAWLLLRVQLVSQLDATLHHDATRAVGRFDASRRFDQPRRFDPSGLASLPAWAQPEVATLFGLVNADGRQHNPRFQSQELPVGAEDVAVAIGQRRDALRNVWIDKTHYRMLTVHSPRGDAVQVARQLTDVDATLDRFAVLMAAADLMILAVTAALGYALTRAGLRPVDRVRRAAEHVARTQNLDAAVPIEPSYPSEVASVADSVNAILTALGASRAAQRQLVEDAGHELATPLTSLRTNIDLLLREEQHPGRRLAAEDRAKLLADLQAQTGELSNLIAEVVDLARDAGNAEETVEFDFSEVVRAAVTRARTRTPEVNFLLTAEHVMVIGRRSALERAALNLLDNAAKWGPPGKPVEVSVGPMGPFADLIVADRGPGVNKTDLERVFERFYRSTEARAMPGSGLGLAIVHQVVSAHHGGTWLAARPGGGTEAHIRLPATTAANGTQPSNE